MDPNAKVRMILDDLMDLSVSETSGRHNALVGPKRDIIFLHLLREISDQLYMLRDDWQEVRNAIDRLNDER